MGISRRHGEIAPRFGPLLLAVLVCGCAGFEPFQPRNDRVEGPEQGLFSGEAGEFVIFERGKVEGDQVPESLE